MSLAHEKGGSWAVGAAAFLANALPSASSGIESWLPVFVQSGAIGLLAFVLWHVFAKFIPRILDGNKEMMKDMGAILDDQRKDFQQALKEHRTETKEAMKEFSQAVNRMPK